MSNVYEVIVDGGARVEFVKGDHAFVENGFLHIQNDTGENVALFATFDYVTAQPATKEE
jgi:hypothetical protein